MHRLSISSGFVGLATALAITLGGCKPAEPAGTSAPPPVPLSVVAMVDPSADQLDQSCQLLAAVIQAGATPSETLVVATLSRGPLGGIYTVRGGDSLNAVAGSHGMPLDALEAANPQLGPVVGRDWNRIHPGDRVTIPGRQAGQAENLVVTRAPAGPPPPTLVRLPQRPKNPTTFQRAKFEHLLASDQAINRDRLAAWRAEAARELRPWQESVAAQLQRIATNPPASGSPANGAGDVDLSASIQSAATTLSGLGGRRVLLLLGAGRSAPPDLAARNASLAGIQVVLAGQTDEVTAMAWKSAAAAAGVAMTALDPALTQLQLPSVVNGPGEEKT
jgi:LysM repeat protein